MLGGGVSGVPSGLFAPGLKSKLKLPVEILKLSVMGTLKSKRADIGMTKSRLALKTGLRMKKPTGMVMSVPSLS